MFYYEWNKKGIAKKTKDELVTHITLFWPMIFRVIMLQKIKFHHV